MLIPNSLIFLSPDSSPREYILIIFALDGCEIPGIPACLGKLDAPRDEGQGDDGVSDDDNEPVLRVWTNHWTSVSWFPHL